MSMQPTWFGGPGSPRFGWLHVPDSKQVRSAVVCCPPVGTEGLGSHWVLRSLADDLAAAGVLVLRFDYRGTGDSSGTMEDLSSVDLWLEDVATAIAHVRALGVEDVALVGLRLGALLAAKAAAEDGGVAALVLWDPCNGRAFLREQKALKLLSLGPGGEPADGAVELLAMVLAKPFADELKAMGFEKPPRRFARGVLVLERPERPGDARLSDALAGQPHDRLPAEGMHELIDVEPGESRLPEQTLKSICRWLDERLPTSSRRVEVTASAEALVRTPSGVVVRERAVVLEPSSIAAIVTEPAGAVPARRTAFFLNAGLMHRIGPGRLWVDLARELAAGGMAAVRFDLSGIGDSGGDATLRIAYTPQAVDDVTTAIEAFCPERRDVVLVGLCSGSYHAAEAAIVHGVGAVCLLNPATVWFDPSRVRIPGAPLPGGPELAVNPIARWMRRREPLLALMRWRPIDRLRTSWLAARIDGFEPLWHLLDRAGVVKSPVRVLAALAAREVDVLLVCGPFEAKPFARWGAGTRALEARGQLRYERFSYEDHSLFLSRYREVAKALVLDHLLGPSGEQPAAAAAAPPAPALLR